MDHLVETPDSLNGNVGVGKRVLTKEISEMRKITWKRLDKSFIGIGSLIFLIVSIISYSGGKRNSN